MATLLGGITPGNQVVAQAPAGTIPPANGHTIYLPLIARALQANEFPYNQPIWPHNDRPADHEVALFRYQFSLASPLQKATLQIFADTRYEVWLNGKWLGRGPARFSQTRHEYDPYALGTIPAGDNLVAVLVQWSPNIRRAESFTPHLLAHIQGQAATGPVVIARTGPAWQAISTTAWRQDAAPVHLWDLIGPTEIVDLRQLPADWMQPGFAATDWGAAAVRSLPATIAYPQRSIPLLSQVPFTTTVIDAGLLSPGRWLGQVAGAAATPYTWPFTVTQPTTITVESLAEPETGLAAAEQVDGRLPFWIYDTLMEPDAAPAAAPAAPVGVLLDGRPLSWKPAGAQRPDVYLAQVGLLPGEHQLAFAQSTTVGPVFAVTADQLRGQPPFVQSNHAGRRLLLAEPISQWGVLASQPAASNQGIDLHFTIAPAYGVIDLGRVVHGRLVATVEGPAGAIVDVGWDERLLTETERPLPHPGSLHGYWNQVDSWTLDGTARSITTLDARAGRYLLLAVWGAAPVKLTQVRVLEERYPVTQRGWFRSSNPRLNAVWQLGVDTAYASMQDAYADPWRERGQWWGDAYVADHINRVAFGETALLRRGLLFMGASLRNGQPLAFAPNGDGSQMLDYSMLWVQSIEDYLTLTNDRAFVATLYPPLQTFVKHLASLRNPTTGLLDIPSGHWSQTALIDWAGVASRTGQSTALNALYYQTLLDAATIAQALNDGAAATAWRAAAATLRSQIEQHLFLPDRQAYTASIVHHQALAPTSHAQAWPLAFAIPAPERVDAVAETLLDDFNVEIFGMFWALEGLYQAGQVDEAVNLIEEKYGRLLDNGATTLWESWRSNQHYPSALSHSWGGAPTWFLSTRVLGAQRTGVASWRVQPAFAGVEGAAGAIPLGDQTLAVQWQHSPCQQKTLRINAPPDSHGEIRLAHKFASELELNGRVVWANGTALAEMARTEGEAIILSVPGGEYQMALRLACAGKEE